MKVEQLNSQPIDWTKPQVVVSANGRRFQTVINQMPKNEFSFCAVDLQSGDYKNDYSKEAFKPESATQYPIELKLTIESDEEFCNIIHRLCVSKSMINIGVCNGFKYNVKDLNPEEISEFLKIAELNNLYKND